MDSYYHVMWYTVWDAKTGDLIASGTAAQCARRLGSSSPGTFASAVSHWMHDGKKHYKYIIQREYILRSEVDSLPQRRKRKKKKPSGVTSAGEPAKG